MCTKGRRQSPIDIEPNKLLFDPYLRPLHIDKHKVKEINYLKIAIQYVQHRIDCMEDEKKEDTKHSQTFHDNINNAIAYRFCCICFLSPTSS